MRSPRQHGRRGRLRLASARHGACFQPGSPPPACVPSHSLLRACPPALRCCCCQALDVSRCPNLGGDGLDVHPRAVLEVLRASGCNALRRQAGTELGGCASSLPARRRENALRVRPPCWQPARQPSVLVEEFCCPAALPAVWSYSCRQRRRCARCSWTAAASCTRWGRKQACCQRLCLHALAVTWQLPGSSWQWHGSDPAVAWGMHHPR